MSPRRTRRPAAPAPPPSGPEQVESWPDGDWVVRPVPGAGVGQDVPLPGM